MINNAITTSESNDMVITESRTFVVRDADGTLKIQMWSWKYEKKLGNYCKYLLKRLVSQFHKLFLKKSSKMFFEKWVQLWSHEADFTKFHQSWRFIHQTKGFFKQSLDFMSKLVKIFREKIQNFDLKQLKCRNLYQKTVYFWDVDRPWISVNN